MQTGAQECYVNIVRYFCKPEDSDERQLTIGLGEMRGTDSLTQPSKENNPADILILDF